MTGFDKDNKESGSSNVDCATTKKEDTTAPTTPTNLTATAVSSSSSHLAWSPSTDDTRVAGYVVYRGTVPVDAVSGLTSNDLGLKAATKYCYTVSAFDEAGNASERSGVACATTNSTGAWNMYLACVGQPYILQNNLDLDETISSNIQVTGTGYDYDGTPLAYVVAGLCDSDSKLLDGSITFTFEGSSCVREDIFEANLTTGDSGDTVMNQIRPCGCTAVIRFVKTGVTSVATPAVVEPAAGSQTLGRR